MKGILVAGTLATLFSFLFTPNLIRIFSKQKILWRQRSFPKGFPFSILAV